MQDRSLPPAPTISRLYNVQVRILISAGEASGEMYGAQLIEALRRREPSAEFFGVGGERMRAAGIAVAERIEEIPALIKERILATRGH